jgi:Flp pilus assembly protein CpaB
VRNWRVLTAIAAVVLAALAGVLVWKYTDNAKNDAKKPFTFTSALVAKSRVAASTSFDTALDSGLIAREQRVRNDVPASGIDGTKSDAQLKTQYANLIAGHDIAEGQMIVSQDFVATGSVASGLGGTLSTDEGKVGKSNAQAISINLDDTHAVGGFLSPGDRVNVIATVDITDATSNASRPVKTTAFLMPGIKVLAVGATTSSVQTTAGAQPSNTTPSTAQANPQSRGVITLEVGPRQAEQIAHAAQLGTLWLTLNPSTYKPGDFKVDSVQEIAGTLNLFDQPLNTTDKLLAALKAANGGK